MSRVVSTAAGVAGLLVFLPGAALLTYTLLDLKSADVGRALTPFASVPLDSVGKQPLTVMKVVIPDNAQWQRIRRKWGTPEFTISAVSSNRQIAYCLADLKMGIEIYLHGKPIQTEISIPPYGYSAYCNGSSLRFRAASGTELQVAISRTGQRPLPSGEVIVIGYWFATKDWLVSNELDKELFRPIAIAASILGFVLIGLAIQFERRRTLLHLSTKALCKTRSLARR